MFSTILLKTQDYLNINVTREMAKVQCNQNILGMYSKESERNREKTTGKY